MPNPRLVMHVGLPKCGSSSLQHALISDRERMRDAGIFYPETMQAEDGAYSGRKRGMAFLKELKSASRGKPSSELASRAEEFARSSADTMILSSEGFIGKAAKLKKPAFAPIAGFDVELVAFYRRADEWAVSRYKHLVRNAERQYESTFDQYLRGVGGLRAFPLVERLDQLSDVLSPTKVHVFDLDAQGTDVRQLFGGVIGYRFQEGDGAAEKKGRNALLAATGRPINQSLSETATLYLLRCNQRGLGKGRLKKVVKALTKLDVKDGPGPRILSRDASVMLLDTFAKTNAEIGRYGGTLSSYAPRASVMDGPPREALTDAEIRALTEQIVPHLDDAVRANLLKVVGGS